MTREPYRPHVHYTPERHWINDPNGLVFVGGVYHLFYQYNPHANGHGHISWGHATSPDLVHWQELGVALPERDHQIFSGSAAVDWPNTLGLGTPERPAVVACYTGHGHGKEAQFLAFSLNAGLTWQYHSDTPVLNLGKKDFRDPKLFWHAASRRWVMLVVHPDERQIGFYASADLQQWTPLSVFGPAGATGGIWEVPELFTVRGEAEQVSWVLKVDLNPGGPHGGSGVQYWLGDFDGEVFTAHTPARWVDHGKDFYAALSFSGVPERRIWLAWMGNWQYAHAAPTSPWRGSMSLPRELVLVRSPAGLELAQRPVPELRALRQASRVLGVGPHALNPQQAHELLLRWPHSPQARVSLAFRSAAGAEVSVEISGERISVVRPASALSQALEGYAGEHFAPLPSDLAELDLQLFLDAGSIEVFAAGGRVCLTEVLFPTAPISEVVVSVDSAQLQGEVWPLTSAPPRRPEHLSKKKPFFDRPTGLE